METNFNKQSILFQNEFYIIDNNKKVFFKVPSIREIYTNYNNLEILLSILKEPIDKVSAILFKKEKRIFKTIGELLNYAARSKILIELGDLVEALETYFKVKLEKNRLINNGNKISDEALNEISKNILKSFTRNFKLEVEDTGEFIPPDTSQIEDEFVRKMVIQEAETAWRFRENQKKTMLKEENTITTDGIFAAVMEAFKITIKEISNFNLYSLYWHYQSVHTIDNQIVLRIAQGNGLLDGKKYKYDYVIDKKGE